MNSHEASRLLKGHGRVVCKLCSIVLASCRCMAKHEPIMVICDGCIKKAHDHEKELANE